MKCAGCEIEFPGIMGLMPREVPGLLMGRVKQHQMLCRDCMLAAKEKKDEYARASRGA